ncbi:MAG: ferritin family protein [Clostridia bacterium]
MELKESKTYLNLAKSYAGECQARTRYEFMEYGARKQGYKALADLIDKVVYNEFNHARMFYTYIQKADDKEIKNIDICSGYPFKEKWDLVSNLGLAVEDETNESTKIYPEYSRIAEEEGFPVIATLYNNIIQVENCHKMLFHQLYDQMNTGTMYKTATSIKWKCADCGYEATSKEAWKICPLCGASQGVVLIQIME